MSALLTAELDADGALAAARITPLALDDEAAPHPDADGRRSTAINELSAADIPGNGVVVGAEGMVAWGRRSDSPRSKE